MSPETCACCGAQRCGIQENRFAFACGTIATRWHLRWRVRLSVGCYLRRICA